MEPKKCLKRMFETFANNAVVNKPESQKKADSAYRWVQSHFTSEEVKDVEIARAQVLDKTKSRKAFKEVCKKIRKRLF